MTVSADRYIDSHLHLQENRIAGLAGKIIAEARRAGIERLFCNGTHEGDWSEVLELAKTEQAVYPFLGIHPWHVDPLAPGWLPRLEALLAESRAGIGEIGLDGTKPNLNLQTVIFQEQLKLAVTLRRPVVIHCVKAWGRLLETLGDIGPSSFRFMVHGYSGSREIMKELVKIGGFISYSTMLAHPDRDRLRRVFIETPLDHVLLETDSPFQFCATMTIRRGQAGEFAEKKLNHPLALIKLYEYAARLHGMDVTDFSEAIWRNGKIFTN